MRMYHFALFFAIVGVVAGISNYVMIDMGYDNWYDQPGYNMQVIDVGESDVTSMQAEEDYTGIDQFENTLKYTNILWNVIKGVLGITFILDDFLVFDVGGINLFAPVLYLFQSIIWLIYIMGSVQFILNRSTKGME